MNDELLAKIEAAAIAAKPWWNPDLEAAEWDDMDYEFRASSEENSDFIQAANPQAILELIADYKRLQFDVVNLLFRDKLAKEIIEPLALEGNPRARFWMAGFGRKIAIDEPPRPEPLQHFAEYVLGMDSWCKHLESTGGIHPTIALQLRQAAENALQGHPPLWMAHWERRAKKLERDYKQLESVNNDAQRLIIEQQQTIARLRTELAAKSPPPAVAPYHRLDAEDKLSDLLTPTPLFDVPDRETLTYGRFMRSLCSACGKTADDFYLISNGDIEPLCKACADKFGVILAD